MIYGFNEDKSKYDMGSGTLNTSNKTVIGAINELKAQMESYTAYDDFTLNKTYFQKTSFGVARQGNLVNIKGHFRTIADVPNADVVLCTDSRIPTPRFSPLYAVMMDKTDGSVKRLSIQSGGLRIQYDAIPNNHEVFFNVTYICW